MNESNSTDTARASALAGKRLWILCGDQSFAWSDLDDIERDHWIGIAQKVVHAYQVAMEKSA